MRPIISLGVVALLALGACDDPWLAPGGDRATATTHVRVPSGDIDLVGATIVDGTVVSSAGAELGLVDMPGVRYRDPSGISPRAGEGGRAEGEWRLAASRSRTRTETRPRSEGGTICWYLVTYRISTGEIVSEELLFCSGGGGPGCDDEQERIAQEYTDYAVEERDHPACDEIEENGNDATYFSWDELNGFWTDGNPHTNYGWVSQTLKDNLDQLRTNYGEPLALSSGYRCPHGNASIQGASATSWHLEGRAADISVKGLAGVSNDWNGMSAAERARVEAIWRRLDGLATSLGARDRQPFTEYADRHYHAAW